MRRGDERSTQQVHREPLACFSAIVRAYHFFLCRSVPDHATSFAHLERPRITALVGPSSADWLAPYRYTRPDLVTKVGTGPFVGLTVTAATHHVVGYRSFRMVQDGLSPAKHLANRRRSAAGWRSDSHREVLTCLSPSAIPSFFPWPRPTGPSFVLINRVYWCASSAH